MASVEFAAWLTAHGWDVIWRQRSIITCRRRDSTREHMYRWTGEVWRLVNHKGRRRWFDSDG